MKITFILSSLHLSGGVRDVVEVSNRLLARGHAITLVTPRGTVDPDISVELAPGIEIREAGQPGAARSGPLRPLRLARLSWALARAVPATDYVISTQAPTTLSTLWAARLLRRGRAAWFYQDYLEMFTGRPIESWLVRNARRWHELAFTLSQHSKEELEQYAPGGPVRVAGAGLSHAAIFQPTPDENKLRVPGKRVLLYLGDMRPRKGLFDFLAAAEILHARRPDLHLWIVSKEDCHINTSVPFEYIYRPTRPELARLYGSCDAFVLAAWWESFGFPPLEAMSCAAPVVLADNRGCRDFARPGENCLMVPIRQPALLAQAIEQVLDDPELAARLSRSGPPTAARFNWDAVTDRVESWLKEFVPQAF